eukprot:TRINITY_DN7478_c0_g2_i2.p1 TRINITY_DN7478_c0_g2~~TRINITY_DN7478_c0_g2_i2.p1  ORF type:complete len:382 (-),score=52.08 TRINITY_DN7478_c0_g2_i2:819-1799(-)
MSRVSSLSVLDFLHLGSSLSLRSLARLGSSLSVLKFSHIGSSLSLRGYARLGSTLSVMGKIAYGIDGTYTLWDDYNARLATYVQGIRALSIRTHNSYVGGYLHGLWYSDNIVHISDKKLKTNIRPLVETLRSSAKFAETKDATDTGAGAAAWILRQLRPVSYNFKSGPDSKHQRLGFIAQEIAEVLPQVVRQRGDDSNIHGIAYHDLTAVLTASLQSLTQRFEEASDTTQGLKERLAVVETGLKRLTEAVDTGIGRLQKAVKQLEEKASKSEKKLAEAQEKITNFQALSSSAKNFERFEDFQSEVKQQLLSFEARMHGVEAWKSLR